MDNQIFAISDFSKKILNWYDDNARVLRWRSPPGHQADAYHVWLSEIMLQQTTVVTVGPYFEKFLANWPTVEHLARAPLDDVLVAWAGLGYYARARNLHKCAVMVCQEYGGKFPATEDELLSLPGIGSYTAAAVTAIAYGKPAVVVDGNIERIITRIHRVQEVLPAARNTIREYASKFSPKQRPGDYAQALMDIGATVCIPRNPKCDECPVMGFCAAKEIGDPEKYPLKAPKKVKPTKRAAVLWVENHRNEILLRRREEKGLLGGMMEFPSTDWQEKEFADFQMAALIQELGAGNSSIPVLGGKTIKHTFTHFHLYLTPYIIQLSEAERINSNQLYWKHPDQFETVALPTLMTKVARSVANGQGTLNL